ncbi:unnamed protein product [Durusdinium trenchii]|uniref:Uncharacterized protein n=1 Tax=Durusdinium trenchii TaxID=1381693 RepID=A0ABP0PYZ6_9DINO
MAGVQDLRAQLLQAESNRKEALQILCSQQEQRAKALEEMNSRKEEQLVKLHNRLQEALTVLQEGQKMYAQQQQQMDAYQQQIEKLCQSKSPVKLHQSKHPSEAFVRPSSRTQERPSPAADEEKSRARDEEKARAGKQEEEKARDREEKAGHEDLLSEDINEFLGMDTSEAEQVLAALQALLAEKEQLHQQLLSEQAEAEERLKALREMGA